MPRNEDNYHLRDLIRSDAMSALSNNAYCVLLTVLYVKVGLEIASYCCWIRKRQQHHYPVVQTPRILVHLCLSCTILFWPLYDPSDWSWRLNALVPSAVATRLLYKVSYEELHCTMISHRLSRLTDRKNDVTKPQTSGHSVEGLRR